MIKKLYDMGYEEFAKRDELRRTLSHALTDGLCSNAKKTILCDFSADGRSYTGLPVYSEKDISIHAPTKGATKGTV